MYSLKTELELLEKSVVELKDEELYSKFCRVRDIAKLLMINIDVIKPDNMELRWFKRILDCGISKRPIMPLDNFPENWVLIEEGSDIFNLVNQSGFTHYHKRYEKLVLHQTGFCAFISQVHLSTDYVNWYVSDELTELVKVTEFPCFPPKEKYLVISPNVPLKIQIENGNYVEVEVDA